MSEIHNQGEKATLRVPRKTPEAIGVPPNHLVEHPNKKENKENLKSQESNIKNRAIKWMDQMIGRLGSRDASKVDVLIYIENTVSSHLSHLYTTNSVERRNEPDTKEKIDASRLILDQILPQLKEGNETNWKMSKDKGYWEIAEQTTLEQSKQRQQAETAKKIDAVRRGIRKL